jgi:hypothetical protein
MREVGNTQIEGDGRLHTMLADPEELPVQEPAMAPIPRPPPARARKSGPPGAPIVVAILLVVAVACVVTVLALGYTIEIGDYEIGFG